MEEKHLSINERFLRIGFAILVIAFLLFLLFRNGFHTEEHRLKLGFPEGNYRLLAEVETDIISSYNISPEDPLIAYSTGSSRANFKVNTKIRYEFDVHVEPKDPDGTQKIVSSLSHATLRLDGNGRVSNFDTAGIDPGDSSPFRYIRHAVGIETTMIIDENGKIVESFNLEEIRAQLPDDIEEELIANCEGFLKYVPLFLESIVKWLPPDPVKPGGRWNSEGMLLIYTDSEPITVATENKFNKIFQENGIRIAEISSNSKKKSDGSLFMQFDGGTCSNLSYDLSSILQIEVDTGLPLINRSEGITKYDIRFIDPETSEYVNEQRTDRLKSSYTFQRK